MNIKQKRDGDKLIVYVEGSIDTNTHQVLNEYLQKELNGVKDFTLDLEKVDYISSAGLRSLLFAQKTMDSQGKMIVTHVNSDIMETFELTCFTDFLTIV